MTSKQGGIALQLVESRLSAPGEPPRSAEMAPTASCKGGWSIRVNRLTLGRDVLVHMDAPGSFPTLATWCAPIAAPAFEHWRLG